MIQDKEQSLESYVDQLTDFDSSVIELTEWLKEIEEKFQSEDGLKATIGLKKSQFNSLQVIKSTSFFRLSVAFEIGASLVVWSLQKSSLDSFLH